MVKGVGAQIEAHTFDDVATYAGLDAEWTWKLYLAYKDHLKAESLNPIFNLEMDVLNTLCHMELRGADIDVTELHSLKDNLEKQLQEMRDSV